MLRKQNCQKCIEMSSLFMGCSNFAAYQIFRARSASTTYSCSGTGSSPMLAGLCRTAQLAYLLKFHTCSFSIWTFSVFWSGSEVTVALSDAFACMEATASTKRLNTIAGITKLSDMRWTYGAGSKTLRRKWRLKNARSDVNDNIPDLHFHPIPSEHPDNETKKAKIKTEQNGGAMSHGGRSGKILIATTIITLIQSQYQWKLQAKMFPNPHRKKSKARMKHWTRT